MGKTLVFDGESMQIDAVLVEPLLELGLAVARLRQPEMVSVPAVLQGAPVVWTAVLNSTTTLGVVDDRSLPDIDLPGSEEAAERLHARWVEVTAPPLLLEQERTGWLGHR